MKIDNANSYSCNEQMIFCIHSKSENCNISTSPFYLLNTLFDDIIKIRSLDSARLSFKCITFLLNWGICVQFTNHHFFFFKWKDIHSVCIKRLIRGTTIWEIKHKLWICEMSYSFFDVFGWHVQLVKTSSVTNSVFIWWHTSMWNEFRHQ